jgi:hypothetical protein
MSVIITAEKKKKIESIKTGQPIPNELLRYWEAYWIAKNEAKAEAEALAKAEAIALAQEESAKKLDIKKV